MSVIYIVQHTFVLFITATYRLQNQSLQFLIAQFVLTSYLVTNFNFFSSHFGFESRLNKMFLFEQKADCN